MNKKSFIKKYREKFENKLNRKEALEDINSFFEILKNLLEKDRKVKFHERGVFYIISKKDRVISNPSTRERMKIKGKNTVKFRASSNFLKKIEGTIKNNDI